MRIRNPFRRPRPKLPFPPGHFYSPIVDPAALDPARLWPRECPPLAGVDFGDAFHRTILCEWFPRYIGLYDYAENASGDAESTRFVSGNSQFGWLDSRALFVLLHALAPTRVIEVGAGYSSLLMADVNVRWRGGAIDITCIDPYPRAFLRRGIPGITRLVERKVEQLDAGAFAALDAGDILFVDSSHVAKTGSDVNFLVFEALPTLKSGVVIHFHDVFLPAEYPRHWAVDDNRSWNEQYLLRALLMYSDAFEVVFGSMNACLRYPELVERALGGAAGQATGGSSFWLRRR